MLLALVSVPMLLLAGSYPVEIDSTRVYAMDPIVVTGTRIATLRSEIPQIRSHYGSFGDRLPRALAGELERLVGDIGA